MVETVYNKAADGVSYYTPAQIPASGTAVDPQPDGRPIPKLFQPLKIRGVTFQNRIWLSPLCQYSAEDGHHTSWHQSHLGSVILRGAGSVMVEATSVTPEGRITPEDSGLWKDSQIEPLRKTVEFAHSQNQKIGIQLGHAGRKGSTIAPWLGRSQMATKEAGGWPDEVVAPSAIAYNDVYPVPKALTLEQIEDLKKAYADTTRRALEAGFDFIEIHNAHGYLLHEFVSPYSNKRTDQYGGSFENRTRLTLEVVDIIRSIIPKDMPLFVRISATDGLEKEAEPSWRVEDSARLAGLLADHGVDLLDVSSYALSPNQEVQSGPAYQAPYAIEIKKAVGDKLLVSTVGSVSDGKLAQEQLDKGLDVVFAGRWFQRNPGLVWQFAEDVGVQIHVAHQIAWAFQGFGGKRFKQ